MKITSLAVMRQFLHYDPLTGIFKWTGVGGRRAGSRAGTSVAPRGNRRIRVGDHYYAEHRLAWLFMTGAWPTVGIDHRNGDPADNRWENLREATPQQNTSNTRKTVPNKWGFRGVKKRHGRPGFVAVIRHAGKRHWIGCFETPEAAHAAYVEADRRLRGEFAATLPAPEPISEMPIIMPDAYPTLTQARLREVVDYDPETGIFRWKINGKQPGHKDRIGKVAGTFDSHRYLRLIFDGGDYYAHKMAWLYIHGYVPKGIVDHRNGKPWDNRLGNLREATSLENMRSKGVASTKASGLPKGVYRNYRGGVRFKAVISVDRKNRYLGTFTTPEEAHAAYMTAARQFFGEFARGE